MLTLGIETSCDETSCAVLRGKDELLSNIVSSSLFRHKPFGGVVPEIASRHSLEQIDVVLQEALETAKIKLEDIDLIAVTHGPGLIGSLFVGVSFAKALAYQMKKPLVGVNHLEAHLAANFIGREEPEQYIGLLVSGGHTSLSFHEKGEMKLMGETIDDAAGEAFDKVAKLLGLGYPGGPIIEKTAKEGNLKAYKFTAPKQDGRFDFSFSGVKTAVRLLVEKHRAESIEQRANLSEPYALCAMPFTADICASFQDTAVRWLTDKSIDAAEFKGVQDIVVGGGVSANNYLREKLEKEASAKGIRVWFPARSLTIDNAGMIARRGWELYEKGIRSPLTLTAVPNLVLAHH